MLLHTSLASRLTSLSKRAQIWLALMQANVQQLPQIKLVRCNSNTNVEWT